MRVADLFLWLRGPLGVGTLVVIASTWLAFYPSIDLGPVSRVARELNLWQEGTVGTWFSSAAFALAALSFVPLGWSPSMRLAIDRFERWIFRLAGAGFVVLSADEAARIHERLGSLLERTRGIEGTFLDAKGFPWVLLYAPPVALGVALLARAWWRAIRAARDEGAGGATRWLPWLYGIALASGPVVIACEVMEARLWAESHRAGLVGVFEESLEVVALWCVFALNAELVRALDP